MEKRAEGSSPGNSERAINSGNMENQRVYSTPKWGCCGGQFKGKRCRGREVEGRGSALKGGEEWLSIENEPRQLGGG